MSEPGQKQEEQGRAKSLYDLVDAAILEYPDDEAIGLFRAWFKQRYGTNLLAIVFFGSCLSEKSRSATSFKDFIAVVDNYRRTSLNPLHWLSHWTLPPDLFHLSLQYRGKNHECKYYLISLKQLLDAVSDSAKDFYLLGRLSKRIAVIYYRDEESLELLAQAQCKAMRRAAEISLGLLDRFDLENFIKAIIRLSYLAETRIKDERKIGSLYEAHSEFYQQAYGLILNDIIRKELVGAEGENLWHPLPAQIPCAKKDVEQFLAQSRKRAKARWPKMILTVDNWLDQLLSKLERTYGIKLEIPGWERPIILITGWRHYFRLKREGKIHEHKPEG